MPSLRLQICPVENHFLSVSNLLATQSYISFFFFLLHLHMSKVICHPFNLAICNHHRFLPSIFATVLIVMWAHVSIACHMSRILYIYIHFLAFFFFILVRSFLAFLSAAAISVRYSTSVITTSNAYHLSDPSFPPCIAFVCFY